MSLEFFCKRIEDKKDIEGFLELPGKLYSKPLLTQDLQLEKDILYGTHPLSQDFRVIPYIVYDESHNVVSRCIMTLYDGDDNAYIGFFETRCYIDAVKKMFDMVEYDALKNGKKRLVGPLDCSFWIKYRMKIDNFDDYYTGEPYNLPFYKELWEKCGFKICENYYSSMMRPPTEDDDLDKYKSRLEYIRNKGYEIRHPTKETFMINLDEIYELIIKTYSNFSMFKSIEREKFVKMFESLKYILNYDMVFLAYKENKLVGFFICVPNYRNLTFRPLRYWTNIRRIKKRPNKYIMLYMGVDGKHPGLGGAFAELSKNHLKEHHLPCVSALIREGNLSGGFYKNLVTKKHHYVMLEKNIDKD